MRITTITSTILVACSLAACAKHANEIPAQYVSTMQYNSYSCRQIEKEMNIVSRKASEVGGQVEQTASDDDTQMGVGLILFWPALFFLDGDTPQANEYARLRGEFEALEKAAVEKDCDVKVEPIKIKKPKVDANPDAGGNPNIKH